MSENIIRARHYAVLIVQKIDDDYTVNSYTIISPAFDETVKVVNKSTWSKFYNDCCKYYVGKIITNVSVKKMKEIVSNNDVLKFSESKLFENVYDFLQAPELKVLKVSKLCNMLRDVLYLDGTLCPAEKLDQGIRWLNEHYSRTVVYDTILYGICKSYYKEWIKSGIDESDILYKLIKDISPKCTQGLSDGLKTIEIMLYASYKDEYSRCKSIESVMYYMIHTYKSMYSIYIFDVPNNYMDTYNYAVSCYERGQEIELVKPNDIGDDYKRITNALATILSLGVPEGSILCERVNNIKSMYWLFVGVVDTFSNKEYLNEHYKELSPMIVLLGERNLIEVDYDYNEYVDRILRGDFTCSYRYLYDFKHYIDIVDNGVIPSDSLLELQKRLNPNLNYYKLESITDGVVVNPLLTYGLTSDYDDIDDVEDNDNFSALKASIGRK